MIGRRDRDQRSGASGEILSAKVRGPEFGRDDVEMEGVAADDHAECDKAVIVRAALIGAIHVSDLPTVQTLTFIFAVLIVMFNLIADILYGILDPRIRYD